MDTPSFKGATLVSVDNKGRMAMPSKHRRVLQEYCQGQLVVTGSHERCLLLYPSVQWPEIENQLMDLPNVSSQVRSLQRLILGYATECTMDSSGRFLLPPMLREFANITRQTVLVGQAKKFELWNYQSWNQGIDSFTHGADRIKDVDEALEKIRL